MAVSLSQAWKFVEQRFAPPTADWTDNAGDVYARERDIVSKRRQHLKTGQPELSATGPPASPDTVGLCLSGGGIRSAAFSLGALQALDAAKPTPGDGGTGGKTALSYVDYLSTVSGGGYIGSAMTARMRNGGPFPFASLLGGEEPAALRGIRDRSNYLFPPRDWALTKNAAIYLRGLFANVVRIASWLLLLATLTLWLWQRWPWRQFTVTLIVGSLFLFGLWAWAVLRSMLDWRHAWRSRFSGRGEINSRAARIGASLLLAVLGVAFIELQPVVIAWAARWTWPAASAVGFAIASGLIGALRGPLLNLAARIVGSRTWKAAFARILFAALALPVPLLFWSTYIVLCVRGLSPGNSSTPSASGSSELIASPQMEFWYFIIGVALVIALLPLSANANSLHRLYRERLNAAFFRKDKNGQPIDAIDVPKLSTLSSTSAPYHLINTSINLQASRHLNERGRNADVFVFSSEYVGSPATGYVPTMSFERAWADLDLGMAMAISGAAVSPDMGVSTLRWLAPTLAFLNVRLGYWIRNPRTFHRSTAGKAQGASLRRVAAWLSWHCGNYFLAEALGRLNEQQPEVYLTDGGHSDDLGLYELLHRRCRLVVVVDGEQDGGFRFPSFVALQRNARIDHGIRIEVPFQQIGAGSRAVSDALAEDGKVAAHRGPHCALGVIHYDDKAEHDGLLLYVKSSLSGDEPDYVMDYARRNAAFPHETTVDQFFTEEQFEVYRALGFHALYGVLAGDDCLAVQPSSSKPDCGDAEPAAPLHRVFDDVPLLNELRAALGLREHSP